MRGKDRQSTPGELDREPGQIDPDRAAAEPDAGDRRAFEWLFFDELRERRLMELQARLQARRSRQWARSARLAATFVAGLVVGATVTALGVDFRWARAPVSAKGALSELAAMSSHRASDALPLEPAELAPGPVEPASPAFAPEVSAPDADRAAPDAGRARPAARDEGSTGAAPAAGEPAVMPPPLPSGVRQPASVLQPRQPAARPPAAASARVDVPPPRTLPPHQSVLDLSASVFDWIEAAKRRDVSAQIALYAERIGTFYGWRDFSREDVRAEKLRAFGSGEVLVDTGSPEIRLEPSGQVAIVRFRKRYVMDGDGRARQGEAVQELHWQRTDAGWRIVNEGDAPTLSRQRDN